MSPVDMTVFSTLASTRPRLESGRCAGLSAGVAGPFTRWWVVGWLLLLLLAPVVQARSPEVQQLTLQRTGEGLYLSARLSLEPTPAVEDALLRGVPLYFVWQADLLRERWYWRDKRVASVVRTWRLVYQPLTRRWRLSLSNDAMGGGSGTGLQYALHQSFDSLSAALGSVSRVSRWRIADATGLRDGADQHVAFSFRLDLSLLPRPFQIGLVNQSEWVIELQRRLDVPLHVEPGAEGDDPAASVAR